MQKKTLSIVLALVAVIAIVFAVIGFVQKGDLQKTVDDLTAKVTVIWKLSRQKLPKLLKMLPKPLKKQLPRLLKRLPRLLKRLPSLKLSTYVLRMKRFIWNCWVTMTN